MMSTACVLLVILAAVSADDEFSAVPAVASVQNTCCSQVFLSSAGIIVNNSQEALGIYTISSQKIANNDHPVYIKNTDNGDFYLYYREKGEDDDDDG